MLPLKVAINRMLHAPVPSSSFLLPILQRPNTRNERAIPVTQPRSVLEWYSSQVYMRAPHLDLETSGPSATTGALELASLAGNVWLLVRVWSESEMLDGLTGVLGAAEEESVGTGWGALSELIEGEAFTSGLEDAGTGGCGEAEGSDRELGDFKKAIAKFHVRRRVQEGVKGDKPGVIGDLGNNDNGLVLVCLQRVLVASIGYDARNRHWWSCECKLNGRPTDNYGRWTRLLLILDILSLLRTTELNGLSVPVERVSQFHNLGEY